MQVNIKRTADGKFDIVKWFTFDEKTFVHKVKDHLIYGVMHFPCWAKHSPIMTLKVLHYMFERLSGLNVLCHAWANEEPSNEQRCRTSKDAEKRRAGYTYIKEKGPRANNLNQFQEWTDDQVMWRRLVCACQ